MKEEIRFVRSVTSTNTVLHGLVSGGEAGNGFMLVAHSQSEGRGQRGNSWESTPGENLTVSMVFQPTRLEPADQFMITKVVSLGVIDLLQKLIPDAPWRVKWPNDVYYSDRKIAGILIENVIVGNNFGHSVAGIGLNINQEVFVSDAPNPVSLIQISGKHYDVAGLAVDLRQCLLGRFAQLESGRWPLLNEGYLNLLFRRGEEAVFLYDGVYIKAVITGVDDFGRLLLRRTDNNQAIVAAFKEISYVI